MENNGVKAAVEYVAMEPEAQDQETVKIRSGNDRNGVSGGASKKPVCAQQRTTLEKVLIVALILVVLLCIILIIVMVVNRGGGGEVDGNLCVTTECVQLAKTIKSSLNTTVSPCEDFYEFTCGGWKDKTSIPEDGSRISIMSLLRGRSLDICRDLLEEPTTSDQTDAINKAKYFYSACMNEEKIDERGLDPLRTLLTSLGGWPVANDGSFDEDSWDLVDTLSTIQQTLGQQSLFMTDTKFEDILEKKFYRLRIDKGFLGLRHRMFYLPETMNQDKLSGYLAYMTRLAAEVRVDHDQEQAMREMNDTLQFEIELAKIQPTDEERRDILNLINQMTIANITETSPQINWLKYFQLILHNQNITSSTIVFNFSPAYIEKLGNLVFRTPKRVIANYLMIRVFTNAAEYLTTRIRQIRRDFLSGDRGELSDEPRWKICATQVNEELPQAVGALYVKNHFSVESKLTADDMYKYIANALVDTLDNVNWMDQSTQAKALEKIKYTNELIGYEPYILNPDDLNRVYANVKPMPDTYFENVIRILTANALRSSGLYGSPINASAQWVAQSSVDANAWYLTSSNAIFITAGILQPPFYSRHSPKSLNYGGIGMVIGHELSHGIDNRGRAFGKDGRLEDWWSESSINGYNERGQCLIDQYSSYNIPEIDVNVNGVRTLAENIADNGGIKAAYSGYKKWVAEHGEETMRLPGLDYTHEQLFFINFGQIWCSLHKPEDLRASLGLAYSPAKYRVIGTVSNSQSFADAFKCPKNSPMNPQNKCVLW